MGTMNNKICMVTGANTGIGKETARGLAREGATVILACRNVAKGESARLDIQQSTGRTDIKVMELDLGDPASVRAFAKKFRDEYSALHVLVNNAGVWTTQRSTTANGTETTWATNHLGTFLLTHELTPLLEASAPSRVVVLSSALHYQGKIVWDDLGYERRSFSGPEAYNQSKLANVLFTHALARRLASKNVTVNAVHPGVVATELVRAYPAWLVKIFHWFLLTPEKGAACSLHVATSAECATATGLYFEKSRAKKVSKDALDVEAQERLWKLTEEALGL
jgi:NAD(P)-dependent dehydrogenase (short-subunit alcohol dehydrogenase family)